MLLEFVSLRLPIVLLLVVAAAAPLTGCAKGNGEGDQGEGALPTLAAPAPSAGKERSVPGILDRSHAGTPAPAFSFEDPNGQPTSMAAFRGRPVLVNLWATWCAPCVIEMPSLDALAQREGEALEVLTLAQDLDGRALVTRFFGERDFRAIEPFLDPQMQFMTSLKLGTLPTTILYDSEGKEVWRMVGRAEWESDRVARLLDEAEGG
jgi:thiol-disulfide isomerase/thioredoxin